MVETLADIPMFKLFVSNRAHEIREHSTPDQWHYVASKDNPADDNSRGLRVDQLINHRYLKGPDFLWHPLDLSEIESVKNVSMDCDDSDIKRILCH